MSVSTSATITDVKDIVLPVTHGRRQARIWEYFGTVTGDASGGTASIAAAWTDRDRFATLEGVSVWSQDLGADGNGLLRWTPGIGVVAAVTPYQYTWFTLARKANHAANFIDAATAAQFCKLCMPARAIEVNGSIATIIEANVNTKVYYLFAWGFVVDDYLRRLPGVNWFGEIPSWTGDIVVQQRRASGK